MKRKALGIVLIAALGGCSGGAEFAEVTGNVSFDGKPIKQGTISLESMAGGDDGPPRRIITAIRDGKFRFDPTDGPSPGKHKVFISAINSPPPASTGAGGKGGKEAPPDRTAEDTPPPVVVPDKFNAKSELTVDIKEGLNENVDFTLKP